MLSRLSLYREGYTKQGTFSYLSKIQIVVNTISLMCCPQTTCKLSIEELVKVAATYMLMHTIIHLIQESVPKEVNEFQQLILDVLQQVFLTARDDRILQRAVDTICKDLSWISALTTKQNFCWGLVAACCSKIKIGQESLNWVDTYYKVLNLVGCIFLNYCNKQGLKESSACLMDWLSNENITPHSEHIQRYVMF